MNVDEFKTLLQTKTDSEIAFEVLLASGAQHVDNANILYIRRRLAEVYSTDLDDVGVYIVGSAKLGFSISKKHQKDGSGSLPKFRPFRAESDIDIAVISEGIFNAVWADLSRYAYTSTYLPWRSGKLGHYLVHGWLRPDHFPTARLRRCNDWWDLFDSLSQEQRFGRRRVRGGLFYSLDDLMHYQQRGLAQCRREMEMEL